MKNFKKTMILAILVAFAGFNVYHAKAVGKLTTMELLNLEALADGESGGGPCGGPKSPSGMCQAMNTVNCMDLYGCQ